MFKLNAYQLKWIAIIGMFLSHALIAWWAIIPEWLRFPMYISGGVTFPIMAYFVAEGYRHTSNLKRYMLRLFLVGLAALPFHIVALSVPFGAGNPMLYPWVNIMFSILLSLCVLRLYDKIKHRIVFWLLYIIVIVPVSLLFFEWYFIGVTMVLMSHIIRNEKARRIVPPMFAGVFMMAIAILTGSNITPDQYADFFVLRPEFQALQIAFSFGCMFVAVLLLAYNGERGRKSKWLFYVFYPAHFVLLAAVGIALGLIDLSVLGF